MKEIERILTVSTNLFFKVGIKSVSMDDIARELGISKKTLYQYVENKADLVEQCFNAHMSQSMKRFEAIFKDKDKNAIDELVAIAEINMETLRKIKPGTIYDLKKYHKKCWDGYQQHKQEFIAATIHANIHKGMEEGLYRKDVNVEIITKFYVGHIDLITDPYIFPPSEFNLANIYIEFLRYHIYGIASEKGSQYINKIINNLKEQQNAA